MAVELHFIVFFLISFVLTGLLRVYALQRNIIDIPNGRSSHSLPTPRGGGVAIVITFSIGLAFTGFTEILNSEFTLLLLISGLLVALVGWYDDHGHVKARWRLLTHFVSAGLVVYACGGLPELTFFGSNINLGWVGHFLIIITMVWILNLYNFMDGINGLAAGQAVISASMMGCILFFVFSQNDFANLHWLMAVCAFGFFVWNFPVARIFMGDAGSGFVGLMLGALLLRSSHIDGSLFWAWLILLGVFIVDASFTLCFRVFEKKKFYEAHSDHVYQKMARRAKSHVKVSSAVFVMIIFWLSPIAVMVAIHKIDGLLALLISYLPLIIIFYWVRRTEL